MTPDRVQEELSQPGAVELLASPQPARVAYTGRDGHPVVIPIGFLWTDGELVLATITTSPKARAIAERPRIAVTIDSGATPATARALLLRGAATAEVVDGVPDEYIAAFAKGADPAEVAEFERGVRATYDRMVRIALRPSWARYYDFGAGRLPPSLLEVVSRGAG